MADEELDQGAEPEALNVVRLPRDWLGPREALVPLIPLAGGRSAVADVDGEPVSERRRSQHPGASPPRSVGDAPEAPHLRSVGGIAPPLEEPKGVLSADAFWGEEAQSLHQVVELPRRSQQLSDEHLSDEYEPISAQTASSQPADAGPAQVLRAAEIADEPLRNSAASGGRLDGRRRRGSVLIGATVLAGFAAAVVAFGFDHPAPAPSGANTSHGATGLSASAPGATAPRGSTTRRGATTRRGPSVENVDNRLHEGTHPRGGQAVVDGGRTASHRKPSAHRTRPVTKSTSGHGAPATDSDSVAVVATATPSYTPTAPSVETPPPAPPASGDETDATGSAPTPTTDSAAGAASPPTAGNPTTATQHQSASGGGGSQLPSGGLPSPQQAALAP